MVRGHAVVVLARAYEDRREFIEQTTWTDGVIDRRIETYYKQQQKQAGIW
jgi:hypothetical protein